MFEQNDTLLYFTFAHCFTLRNNLITLFLLFAMYILRHLILQFLYVLLFLLKKDLLKGPSWRRSTAFDYERDGSINGGSIPPRKNEIISFSSLWQEPALSSINVQHLERWKIGKEVS